MVNENTIERLEEMKMTPIEMLTERLRGARILAVYAKMDHHFISDIDHLIATAEANREEESK